MNAVGVSLATVLCRSQAVPRRLKRLFYLNAMLPGAVERCRDRWISSPAEMFSQVRESTLEYVRSNRLSPEQPGLYSYVPGGPHLLYASCYAVLTRHLYSDLSTLSDGELRQWVEYLQSHQRDDGLFRDPLIDCPLAEEIDWWGWRHLTLHVLMGLTALGAVAQKPFSLLEPFRCPGRITEWLEGCAWETDPAGVSNEVQNRASLLQYARDFQSMAWCGDALGEMYGWLDRQQDPRTGLWGTRFDTPYHLSQGVQTGYHLWMLYFHDRRAIKHQDAIVDSCLATQNRLGGFGVPANSSACEDIDSIDPLARLLPWVHDGDRRARIAASLERAVPWILANANPDGGWVFRRNEAFQYGHALMATRPEQSSMFATWFRTLSLAYLGRALPGTVLHSYAWRFLRCPGHQFWFGSGEDVRRP